MIKENENSMKSIQTNLISNVLQEEKRSHDVIHAIDLSARIY